MKNEIIEQVFDDYFEHEENMEDKNYSSIYSLVENLEIWNGYEANLKYDLDIKDNYLYLENTKICAMDKLLRCSAQTDSVKYQLKDNKELYICIEWIDGKDAFITQIYIKNQTDDESEILYKK